MPLLHPNTLSPISSPSSHPSFPSFYPSFLPSLSPYLSLTHPPLLQPAAPTDIHGDHPYDNDPAQHSPVHVPGPEAEEDRVEELPPEGRGQREQVVPKPGSKICFLEIREQLVIKKIMINDSCFYEDGTNNLNEMKNNKHNINSIINQIKYK